MGPQLISFSDCSFNQFSLEDWYDITSLREQVFVVEQNCPYLDADGKDIRAHHVTGRNDRGKIKAYGRLVDPRDQPVAMEKLTFLSSDEIEQLIFLFHLDGIFLHMPAIGRVVLDRSLRGKEVGIALMDYILSCHIRIYKNSPVFISAQQPLRDFYAKNGFVQTGPGYLEDAIPHIPMIFGIDLIKE